MKDIKNYTLKELEELLRKNGYRRFSAQQIFNWIYKKRVEDFSLMTDISKEARKFLRKNFYFSQLKLLKKEKSADGTVKFLFALGDSNSIETVFIPQKKRNTLCISTQVGCKFRCKFCLSGKDGFKRNLETSEIINQYLQVGNGHDYSLQIIPRKITNLVFMGIGEPLDNFDATLKAIKIFIEPKGLYFGPRRICVSTCGLIPEIKKLAALKLGLKLSISLHTADNNLRTKLMPINKKYPLKDLIKAAKIFCQKEKHPITFEYAMIKGYNIGKEDAQKLAKLLRGLRYKINLIALNDSCGYFKPPLEDEVENFKEELKKRGIFFTLREPRGSDIKAACGQLRASV